MSSTSSSSGSESEGEAARVRACASVSVSGGTVKKEAAKGNEKDKDKDKEKEMEKEDEEEVALQRLLHAHLDGVIDMGGEEEVDKSGTGAEGGAGSETRKVKVNEASIESRRARAHLRLFAESVPGAVLRRRRGQRKAERRSKREKEAEDEREEVLRTERARSVAVARPLKALRSDDRRTVGHVLPGHFVA